MSLLLPEHLADRPVFRSAYQWGLVEVRPGLLCIVLARDMQDSVPSAAALLDALGDYAQEQGPPAIVCRVDHAWGPSREVRRFYARNGRPEVVGSAGLVATTRLGRAIGSVFLGLYRPSVPIDVFVDFQTAEEWAWERRAEVLAARG